MTNLIKEQGTLSKWDPEDGNFWEKEGGKVIAYRNLWWSIGCLLIGFCIWLAWSIITVQMKDLGFPFDSEQLFTLSAIAGLTGATLRIPNSFLIAIAGGRNVIITSTALLIFPALGVGMALQSIDTPYSTFVILAALSGIGGGNFASSMSNISFFYPLKIKGLALGLNAGLGNLGVSIGQILISFAMTISVFGVLTGNPIPLPEDIGGKAAGTPFWIQNAGFIWVPILVIVAGIAWFKINNMPHHKFGSTGSAIGKILGLNLLGFAGAAVGLYLLLGILKSHNWGLWVALPITVVITVLMMKLIPGPVRTNLNKQFKIFNSKHNWTMTWLYTMTFGSFIGYSAAFPLLMKVVFGTLGDWETVNPHAPNPFYFAWMGPFIGSVIRPLGGHLSDKTSAAKVTHWTTLAMIITTVALAYFIKQAGASDTPEIFFIPFLAIFLLLFTLTGIGNGSVFAMVPHLFEQEQAGPVVGWISAVAAYGAFILPKLFGVQVKAHAPEMALYGFAVYYLSCLAVNWWFYARRNAPHPC